MILCFEINSPVPSGTLLVINGFEVRAYDDQKDQLSDVIGVSYPKNNSGRNTLTYDGLPFLDNEYYLYNEDLSVNYEAVNPNFDPYFDISGDNYVLCCISGMAAILTDQTVSTDWRLIKEGTTHNIYILQ